MLSLSNYTFDRIIEQGSKHGIPEDRVVELIELYRNEFRREPSQFSDLLEVLE